MGGFMLYVKEKPHLTLRPDHILEPIRKNRINVSTLITAKQIHDKSKGNVLSKGLIMLQVAWFVMQLITRAIYHLETTQLEVGTLAFAVLNFLTYAFWWNKPLNVQCPHPVYWKPTDSRPEDHIDRREDHVDEPKVDIDEPKVINEPEYVCALTTMLLLIMPVLVSMNLVCLDCSLQTSTPTRRGLKTLFQSSAQLQNC
jgi:hypothetical protein